MLTLAVGLCIAAYVLATAYRVFVRKYYVWLPGYIRRIARRSEPARKPVHIFFLFADDFEPGMQADWMQRWEDEYPRLAARHRDASGRPPQHTWFYPGEQQIDSNMLALRRLVEAGYGEVELHLHHFHDTRQSALVKYQEAIAYLQEFGFLKTIDGQTRFGFTHGNVGLDNSMGPAWCGVDTELSLLRELGCFADFTFACVWAEAQPSVVNTIFYASDDPRPKSYDRGVPLRVGQQPTGDLMIFQGPLVVAPTWNPRQLFLLVENADIHPSVPVTSRRVDLWVKGNIHVEGRPDWVFVKVAGHGASSPEDIDEVIGVNFDRALTYLENRYNDGVNYILHYVTAREAYNLVRAAAAGQEDPEACLDWVIPPYQAAPLRVASLPGR